ncbi:MAG: hypothetical protein AAF483_30260 [Planctomycetota bacterium]
MSDDHPQVFQFEDYLPKVDKRQRAVPVSAGEVMALMMHAARTNRAWLKDFSDETLFVSPDLYEILVAYKRIAQDSNSKAA